MGKRRFRLPQIVPVDNEKFYKQVAKEFNIDLEVAKHVIRMNYRFIRKFFAENGTKGDCVKLRNIGYFEARKDRPTMDHFYAKARIMAIISRYNNFRIYDADVEVLKEFAYKGFGIPYYKQIMHIGRRWKEGQVPIPEIYETNPGLWRHLESPDPWIPQEPVKEPEIMKPEDSVVFKYGNEDYFSDSENVF